VVSWRWTHCLVIDGSGFRINGTWICEAMWMRKAGNMLFIGTVGIGGVAAIGMVSLF